MTKLKCIGGPCNGKRYEIDDERPRKDVVRVPLLPPLPIPMTLEEAVVDMEIVLYRIEEMCVHERNMYHPVRIRFLVHNDLSLLDAMDLLLG